VPDQTTNPLLRVNNLRVSFGREHGSFGKKDAIRAVNDVSFDLYQGEVLSIVGESGSGKSTIASCISLLIPPSSGSILYKGLDVSKLRGKQVLMYRKEVQIVYQDPFESLNPRHTVFKILSIPFRRLAGERDRLVIRQKVCDLLKEVGLDAETVVDKFPHQLSGGERQRVNIARALAPGPKLLVADEPITMLDAAQRVNILSLLMRLKKTRNLTVLMITHDLTSATISSNRILVIYLGKVVELGETKAVLSKPYHPYVELIMESMPHIHRSSEHGLGEDFTAASIEESIDIMQGCIFRPRCKYASEICKEVEPPLEEKTTSRYASCHHPLNLSSAPEIRQQ
jgi:oligopeptide/dipeptide ABC transporter ATP-binding protein